MVTSRLDGVKAPRHRGTPRSYGGSVVNGMFSGISTLFSSMRSWARIVRNELRAPSSSRNWSAAAYLRERHVIAAF